MNDILKVENLNKSYGDFSLSDVTFSLPEGCITGFIGINGAGKTTTLRTLLGLTKKQSGKIHFFGLEMEKNEKQIKDRIGIVLDDGCFYDELSLAEMKSIISSAYTKWQRYNFSLYHCRNSIVFRAYKLYSIFFEAKQDSADNRDNYFN